MMARFTDKVVAVSGASRGLGRETALAFAEEGAFVLVGYRAQAHKAEQTLAEISARGGRGGLWEVDVRDASQVSESVRRIVAEHQRVDVLVNNAAIVDDAPFALANGEAWDEVIDVNLAGAARLCRAVLRPMLGAGSGVIVNVASVAALRATPGQTSYAASKAGLLALTRTAAAECAPKGVRVNAVVPGFLDVGMGVAVDRRVVEASLTHLPAGRVGTGREAADAILFLCSDAASYIVGHALVVDGGLSL
jgi:3-oxoacyl-[acyl-carrier protein] reductase